MQGRVSVLLEQPDQLVAVWRSLLGAADVEVATGRLAAYIQDCVRDGVGKSLDGWFDDDLAFVRPWGFELDAIRVPVLHWQGEQDKFVPSQRCLNQTLETYETLPSGRGMSKFTAAAALLEDLQRTLSEKLDLPHDADEDDEDGGPEGKGSVIVDEESEALTDLRTRRVSLVAGAGGMLETKPLHGAGERDDTTVGGVQLEFDETTNEG